MSTVIYIVLAILLLLAIVFVIRKFVPRKFNPIISLLLWVLIAFLGYQLYDSLIGPVKFNKQKEIRYTKVISSLKDIRSGELAYQEINGSFTKSYDSLVRFIDTAQFAITARRDSSYADVEKNKAYGIDEGYFIDVIVVDTLGFTAVKDSLYGGTDRYKTMMNVPGTEVKFDLDAGQLEKNGTMYDVFEAKIGKEIVLAGLNKDLIVQEKQVISVEGVKGPYIKVGAMDDIDTGGNWSKLYDAKGNN